MTGIVVVLPTSVAFFLFVAYVVVMLVVFVACIRELRRPSGAEPEEADGGG